MFRLWCEWDYGQEGVIFTSEAAGRAWLAEAMANDLEEPDFGFSCIKEIFDDCLAGFELVTIIGAS